MSKFLASTALAVVMGLGVATPAFSDAHLKNIASYSQEQAGDIYASELIGMRVYATEKEDYDGWNADTRLADGAEKEWDDIGEVNDVILGSNGEVKAVILGIGGFIGIGEKDVAVAMSDIKMVREEGDSDDFFLVVKSNKQMLTDAEPFQRMSMAEDAETTTENAAAETENATENAAAATENAAEATGEAAENAAEATGEAAENAAEATENATENAAAATENAVEGDNVVVTTTQDADRPMLRQPAEREIEGYRAAEAEELTTETLTGARVYGSNDEDIGEVDKLILDDSGKITKAVLDIGGFLGLGEHEIAVTMDELRIVRTDGGDDFRVYVDATQEELEAQPEYKD